LNYTSANIYYRSFSPLFSYFARLYKE